MDGPVQVTVVIPTYNRALYLPKAVDSVLAQTYTNWKLLIMDDASTDNTEDAVAPYLADKRIRLLKMAKNLGTGKILNRSLSKIKTPFFVILDSDDWLEPNALELLLTEMQKKPESTSLVYGNTRRWKEDDQGLRLKDVKKCRSFQDKYDFIMYPDMLYPRFFRTKSVRKVGGFQSDIPFEGRYGEDRYILLKLIEKSQFHWIDADLYNLRLHSSNLTTKDLKNFAIVRRHVYCKMLKRWGGHYRPIFNMQKNGWLALIALQKIDQTSDSNK